MMDGVPVIGRLSRFASSVTGVGSGSADAESPEGSGVRGEFARGPNDAGVNCFSEPPVDKFSVRGPGYLADAKKVLHTRAPAFTLLDVDIVESTVGRLDHFAAHPESFPARRMRDAAAPPGEFLLVINFVTDRYGMIITYAVDEAKFRDADPAFARLWKAFLSGSDEYRAARLKVIPNIVEGPWAVRKVIGERPAIMGKKLGFTYHQTDRYLEIDCDTASTRAAGVIVEVVVPAASHLVIDQAFLLEGQHESELPERIFGTVRVSRMALRQSRLITTPAPTPPPTTNTR